MVMSSTRLLLCLLIAIALAAAAAAPAAATAAAGQQTWRATLIAGSQQGSCVPVGYSLLDDFTVVYHGDVFGAYPPVLFADASFNGAYLGGALSSAAGYAHGWTWVGTCVYIVSQGQLGLIPCDCNVNLQPAVGSNCHDFAMYMVCTVCPSGSCYGTSLPSLQCLANYKLAAVNASSAA